ncbi:hypothetical protein SAMN05421774_101623 [Gemmobacter megaterium]|uniref:Uncharacterized protein n=1 Tax=Gemmobacter megaterium TaxID=1086013 RepID=A0A1N7KR14_9RHOB|nr:hypothetical protein [Gemmobacter megaterium]GGE03399.1 hypothetical protein GCM10011345_06080 [Gemmobacter megaterium]SIS64039.1 hypothetical protein SAMN05421774_101623 [Gemmobacter megaterium]
MLDHQKIFAARLERIASHAGNTNATLHIGMADQLPQAALKRAVLGKARPRKSGLALLSLPLALASGAVAWVWAQWSVPVLLQSQELWVALLASGVMVLLLRLVIGLRGPLTLAMQLIGVALAVAGLHNAVHLWPEAFAMLFSPDWVQEVLATTRPMSLSLGALLP